MLVGSPSDEGVERFVSVFVHHPSSLHDVHLMCTSSLQLSLFPVLSVLLFSLFLLSYSYKRMERTGNSESGKRGGRERTRERREQGTGRVGEERRKRENKRIERTGNRESVRREEEERERTRE